MNKVYVPVGWTKVNLSYPQPNPAILGITTSRQDALLMLARVWYMRIQYFALNQRYVVQD